MNNELKLPASEEAIKISPKCNYYGDNGHDFTGRHAGRPGICTCGVCLAWFRARGGVVSPDRLPALSEDQLDALLKNTKPATKEELREQGENLANNYRPGPRQAVPFKPVSEDGIGSEEKCECGHREAVHWPTNRDEYKLRRCSDLGCDCDRYTPVLKDGPAEGIDNTPWMDYEDAGKEAYAEERVIVFKAKPTGQKFAAHPEGHYIALTLPVEPTAPVQPKKYLEWAKAGGPNECSHGYAAGIPCPRCDEASQPTPVVVPGKSKLDDISLRSLRTLCMGKMERSGDYAQVSIFAKTILTLLDENAELLTAQPAPLPSDQPADEEDADFVHAPDCACYSEQHSRECKNCECQCTMPPKGRRCTRGYGHTGPCAALPVGQKETFEEWWGRMTEICEDGPSHEEEGIARAAWNAAKGTEGDEVTLRDHIEDHKYLGCFQAAMGRAKIPDGYAIMVDPDGAYCFWLDSNGRTSVSHWSKWAVLRGAKLEAAKGGTN